MELCSILRCVKCEFYHSGEYCQIVPPVSMMVVVALRHVAKRRVLNGMHLQTYQIILILMD